MVRYSGTLRDDLYLRMQVLLLCTRNSQFKHYSRVDINDPENENEHTPKNLRIKASAKKADLVLVIGTSLSGLASDCVPEVNHVFLLLGYLAHLEYSRHKSILLVKCNLRLS